MYSLYDCNVTDEKLLTESEIRSIYGNLFEEESYIQQWAPGYVIKLKSIIPVCEESRYHHFVTVYGYFLEDREAYKYV